MLKKMKNTDITLIILTAVCCIGGILLTFSMAYNSKYQNITSGNPSSSWKTTLIAAAIGTVACIIIAKLGIRRIKKLWWLAAVIGLVGVALTFTSLGVGPSGSDDIAWLRFKGFTIQPSEILKLCFILSFSVHINKVKANLNKPFVLLGLLAHAAVPVALVCLQGDQGTAVVFIIIALIMGISAFGRGRPSTKSGFWKLSLCISTNTRDERSIRLQPRHLPCPWVVRLTHEAPDVPALVSALCTTMASPHKFPAADREFARRCHQ